MRVPLSFSLAFPFCSLAFPCASSLAFPCVSSLAFPCASFLVTSPQERLPNHQNFQDRTFQASRPCSRKNNPEESPGSFGSCEGPPTPRFGIWQGPELQVQCKENLLFTNDTSTNLTVEFVSDFERRPQAANGLGFGLPFFIAVMQYMSLRGKVEFSFFFSSAAVHYELTHCACGTDKAGGRTHGSQCDAESDDTSNTVRMMHARSASA